MPEGADVNEALHTGRFAGRCQSARQLDVGLLKLSLRTVQHRHEVDDRVAARHQTHQFGVVVNVAGHHFQCGQRAQMRSALRPA